MSATPRRLLLCKPTVHEEHRWGSGSYWCPGVPEERPSIDPTEGARTMSDRPDQIASEHAYSRVGPGGEGRLYCKCGQSFEDRYAAFPSHVAEVTEAAVRAQIAADIEAEIHHAQDNGHVLDPRCQGVAPGERVPAVRVNYLLAVLDAGQES